MLHYLYSSNRFGFKILAFKNLSETSLTYFLKHFILQFDFFAFVRDKEKLFEFDSFVKIGFVCKVIKIKILILFLNLLVCVCYTYLKRRIIITIYFYDGKSFTGLLLVMKLIAHTGSGDCFF